MILNNERFFHFLHDGLLFCCTFVSMIQTCLVKDSVYHVQSSVKHRIDLI